MTTSHQTGNESSGGSGPSGRGAVEATPLGLSLRPEEPRARRLSRRMGILVMIAGSLLLMALLYGILTRQQEATTFGRRPAFDPDSRVLSAKDAAKQFSNPSGLPDNADGDGMRLEPPPLKWIPRRGALQQPVTAPDARGAAPLRAAQQVPTPPASPSAHYAATPTGAAGQPVSWESPNSTDWGGAPNFAAGGGGQDPAARAKDREREAMEAGTGANGGGALASRLPTAQGDVNELTGLVNALGANSTVGGTNRTTSTPAPTISGAGISPRAVGTGADEDDGGAASKREFLASTRKAAENNYVQSTRVRALSPYEIKAGWDIPAILEQEINSDMPGEIRALVRENVYDTASGQHLLIPQGARLVGGYDSKIAYGQSALLVVWNRIILPDGSSIDLEGMNSQDVRGASGLRGKVNHHYLRIFGTAALSSAFSIAAVIAQTRRQQVFSYPSNSDIAASAAGSEIARLGSAVTRRNLSIQPTIRILTGTRFAVRVHKDLLFEQPYRPYLQGGRGMARN